MRRSRRRLRGCTRRSAERVSSAVQVTCGCCSVRADCGLQRRSRRVGAVFRDRRLDRRGRGARPSLWCAAAGGPAPGGRGGGASDGPDRTDADAGDGTRVRGAGRGVLRRTGYQPGGRRRRSSRCANVAAGGFGAPPAVLQALYLSEVVDLDGVNIYLGRVAESCHDRDRLPNRPGGAIFNVATSPNIAATVMARRSPPSRLARSSSAEQTSRGCRRLLWGSGSTTDSDSVRSPITFCSAGRTPRALDIWWTSPYAPHPLYGELLATEQLLERGRSRIESKSRSSRAIARQSSHISIAARRCSIASAVRPARLSQQATL